MKFRKKPVVIEAIQYCWNPGVIDELSAWGVSVEPTEHWFGNCNEDGHEENADIYINTLEGKMLCHSLNSDGNGGDWIIKGTAGEFYPCKSEIFEATYEIAEEQIPQSWRQEIAAILEKHAGVTIYPTTGHTDTEALRHDLEQLGTDMGWDIDKEIVQ